MPDQQCAATLAFLDLLDWSVQCEMQSRNTIFEDEALSATTHWFLKLVERGEVPDHPIAWLASVYRRELSRVQRHARRPFRDIDVSPLPRNARTPRTDSVTEELRREFEQRFDEVEAVLTPRQREVLDVLLHTDGHQQAAKELAMPLRDLRIYERAIVLKLRPLFA